MHELLRRRVTGRQIVVGASERRDGDVHPLRVGSGELRVRQAAITSRPWTMTDQVHGTGMLTVDDSAAWRPVVGVADVVAVTAPARPLAVWAADCAPLVLADAEGTTLVAVHAGWRGLAAGVVDIGVDAVESGGAPVAFAVLGPCIRNCCNEFGIDDLAAVAAGVGAAPERLRSVTAEGGIGLDMVAAVAAALERRGVRLDVTAPCTGCDSRWYSSRRRNEPERHAVVAWFEDEP